ncbi:uncharacterized protein BcabD6B2_02280 [Babesia caballi]|uniref:Uncharacterized protein n=1 Tax=Babesia caballi TaxID=5871 RepID=A0AAV4LL64_BABCB|nr:hypothetical protein BcabD6B2_02280 [Babesia caballi]
MCRSIVCLRVRFAGGIRGILGFRRSDRVDCRGRAATVGQFWGVRLPFETAQHVGTQLLLHRELALTHAGRYVVVRNGFALVQHLRQLVHQVRLLAQQRFHARVLPLDHAPHLPVDELRGGLGVGAVELGLVGRVALVRDEADGGVHAPLRNKGVAHTGHLVEVVGRPGGYAADEDVLGGTPAQNDGDLVQKRLAAEQHGLVGKLLREPQRAAAARHDGDLEHGVRAVNGDGAVEPAGADQGWVKDIGTIRPRKHDDSTAWFEPVHLDEDLVEGVLALVVGPGGEPALGALLAHGVNLVDEDDCGSVFAGLFKQIADPGRTYTDKYLNKVASGDGVEGHVGLAGNGLGQQGFAGARRAAQQSPLGYLRSVVLVGLGVLEEVHKLADLALGLVHARHVLEAHLNLDVLGVHQVHLSHAEESFHASRAPGGEFTQADPQQQHYHQEGYGALQLPQKVHFVYILNTDVVLRVETHRGLDVVEFLFERVGGADSEADDAGHAVVR